MKTSVEKKEVVVRRMKAVKVFLEKKGFHPKLSMIRINGFALELDLIHSDVADLILSVYELFDDILEVTEVTESENQRRIVVWVCPDHDDMPGGFHDAH